MGFRRFWVVGIAWGLLAALGAHGADFVLVRDGVPAATVVVGQDGSEKALAASEELRVFVKRMSGAELPLATDSDGVNGPRIFVGHSEDVTALGVEVPSGVTSRFDEEGFVSVTVGDDLVLAGNEDGDYNGTAYAVYDLLEELGCRWYYPGDFGEIIPVSKTLSVPERDRRKRPSFRFRTIMTMGWYPFTDEQRQDFQTWALRNKMSTNSVSFPGDGSIVNLAPKDKFFESMPEIYAMDEKGERHPEMLCLSEEKTVEVAVQTIRDYFAANPDAVSFGFAPADGFPMCFCERCKQFLPAFNGKGYGDPSISEPWFRFVNKIATAIYVEYPEKWILTNGYANRVRPPEGTGLLSPNIGLQSAVLPACSLHRIGDPHCWQRINYGQLMTRWTEALDNVFVYDYTPGISLAMLPEPSLHRLKYDMAWYRDRGIWGFFSEGGHAPMITQLSYYARAKLMWNADGDVDGMLHEFNERFFGQAARPMESYTRTLEKAVEDTELHETWGRIMHWEYILKDVLPKLDRLMAEAEAADVDDATRTRLQMYRYTHDHMVAYVDMENAVIAGDYGMAVAEGNRMLAIRAEAAELRPNWLPTTPDWALDFRTTAEWHINQYQALADRAGGSAGELIGMLPRDWKFKKDPEDIGVLYQWYETPMDRSWDDIDSTIYWEASGYADEKGLGYSGNAWYRTDFDVPVAYEDKSVWLTIGGVYNRGVWIWVNGRMMEWEMNRHHRLGHQDVRSAIHIDISGVMRPGEANTVAVLVHPEEPGRNHRGGLHRRAFLWSPKEGSVSTDGAATPEALQSVE